MKALETSPELHWLRPPFPTWGVHLQSLVRELKIPHALGPKNQNAKQKQYRKKFSKDFKNGLHFKNVS